MFVTLCERSNIGELLYMPWFKRWKAIHESGSSRKGTICSFSFRSFHSSTYCWKYYMSVNHIETYILSPDIMNYFELANKKNPKVCWNSSWCFKWVTPSPPPAIPLQWSYRTQQEESFCKRCPPRGHLK